MTRSMPCCVPVGIDDVRARLAAHAARLAKIGSDRLLAKRFPAARIAVVEMFRAGLGQDAARAGCGSSSVRASGHGDAERARQRHFRLRYFRFAWCGRLHGRHPVGDEGARAGAGDDETLGDQRLEGGDDAAARGLQPPGKVTRGRQLAARWNGASFDRGGAVPGRAPAYAGRLRAGRARAGTSPERLVLFLAHDWCFFGPMAWRTVAPYPSKGKTA